LPPLHPPFCSLGREEGGRGKEVMGAGFVGSQKSPGWSSFGENKKKNFVEERLENLNLKYYICKSNV